MTKWKSLRYNFSPIHTKPLMLYSFDADSLVVMIEIVLQNVLMGDNEWKMSEKCDWIIVWWIYGKKPL